jgi:diacylglycerol O-acyltransferase
VSIPMHGMALNITLQSYADTLNFGFIGCRDTLPHLQRLAVYTGEALDDLEAAKKSVRRSSS